MTGAFRLIGERLIHHGHVMDLVEGTFEAPDGSQFSRDVVRHPGAVAVVPVDGADVIMVRQYRPAIDDHLLEIPAGTRDLPGEDPIETAKRELAEEIGATASHMRHLATYLVAPGVSDELMYLFMATGLTMGQREAHGLEEQHMTLERIALAEAPTLITNGRIVDAKSIVGLLLALRTVAA